MDRFVVLRCYVGVLVIFVSADLWAVEGCSELVKSTRYHLDTYKNTCYMFVNQEMYWGQASQYCFDMGGDLVAITRADIQDFINKKLRSRELGWRNNGVWIGARYYEDTGWIWTTGEKVQYGNWARGQPGKFLNWISFENCAAMKRGDNWKWHDFHCRLMKFHYKFICQFPATEHRPPDTPTTSVTTTSTSQYLASDVNDLHTLSPGVYLYVVKDNNVKHSLLRVLEAQGVAQSGAQDNGNTLILVVVISLAVLLILVMLIIFFIYRRRQHVKHSREVPAVRFDNLAYSQIQAGQQNMENANRSRPNSNIYLTPSEVNAPYTEPSQMYHGNGMYGKEGLVRSDPLPPLPTASSNTSMSREEQGACGGSESLASEPLMSLDKRADVKAKQVDSNRLSNAYVDMSSLDKVSGADSGTTSVKVPQPDVVEPVYSNIVSSPEKVESLYEVLP
ncbi:uncharacterized protein LOC121378428 isoform X1 [Gigantopelta aegis]|uniref:uncharacterized protein LOC121378428 isoform X1 n=1 Tax=Gigantopelta aegis TaxID=1735272 RepID=UPI001B88DB0E|nr:uncharacterized protein LOC121378428 isoform X1 [Gigantopelta aegis]